MKYYLLFFISIAGYSINAQQIDFAPTSFSNSFSLNVQPVLKIKSGDFVNTETIDAAGYDKNGVKRQKGGNPLNGPFYIDIRKLFKHYIDCFRAA